MAGLRFLPPLAWTALVLWLSSPGWSAAETSSWILPLLRLLLPWAAPEQLEAFHWLVRKGGHAVEYAVLAALWRHALAAGGRPAGWPALGLAVLTAGLDESLQSLTPARGGSIGDVLLDSAGAAAMLAVLACGVRRAADGLTAGLLWLAAAGGTALLALHWGAGIPAGWLAWSVPAAWLALVLWHRWRRAA